MYRSKEWGERGRGSVPQEGVRTEPNLKQGTRTCQGGEVGPHLQLSTEGGGRAFRGEFSPRVKQEAFSNLTFSSRRRPPGLGCQGCAGGTWGCCWGRHCQTLGGSGSVKDQRVPHQICVPGTALSKSQVRSIGRRRVPEGAPIAASRSLSLSHTTFPTLFDARDSMTAGAANWGIIQSHPFFSFSSAVLFSFKPPLPPRCRRLASGGNKTLWMIGRQQVWRLTEG